MMLWNDFPTHKTTLERVFPEVRRLPFPELCKRARLIFGEEHGQYRAEERWWKLGRPFYNVWPSIVPGLLRTRLDIPCDVIRSCVNKLPETLVVRFASSSDIKSFLFSRITCRDGSSGIGLWIDTGETHASPVLNAPAPVMTWGIFALEEGNVMSSILKELDSGADPTVFPVIERATKILVCLSMMTDSTELIEPIVLNKDRTAWRRTGDLKYVERAKSRGQNGFNVGARIEVSPHYRNPYLGLRWTGPGGAIPKIVPIKGCIVRRHAYTDVPSGYLEEKEQP